MSTQRPFVGLPRWLRVLSMGVIFLFFFAGSPVIALVLFPMLRVLYRNDYRRRCTYLLHRGMHMIAVATRFAGVVDFELAGLPASVDPSKPYVMICNHPTYVDMILVLGRFANLTCVTSGRWSRHWALGRLLRSTTYLPGPGSGLPESEHMLDTMVAHLGKGHPLLIFPEGQRSTKHELRRFRRGAVEAATAANVPIVPLFLAIDRPYLTKDVPLWKPPIRAPKYSFEWFDVIRPDDFGRDAKRIHRHIEALYDARFEEQRVLHEALEVSAPLLPA